MRDRFISSAYLNVRCICLVLVVSTLPVHTSSRVLADPPAPSDQPPVFESSLLSDTHHFANNPAVAAKAKNDELSVAWVRHFPEKGDEIVVFDTSHNGIEIITPHRGQYLRP